MSTSDTNTEVRHGEYRELALAHYGEACQEPECGWKPPNEALRYKLHVHHVTPRSEGGPDDLDNLTVLCRDCHLSKHSLSEYSHELVGRLTRTLAESVTHKTDGFADRVGRRVRLDSVTHVTGETPEDETPPLLAGVDDDPAVTTPAPTTDDIPESDADSYALVEGLLDGDHYDEYFVDTGKPYLQMCSCYTHSGGFRRARNLCTHAGASIVRRAVAIADEHGEERALQYIQAVGNELDEKAADFIQTQDLVSETIDTLDIDTRFSENWATRAERQANKMTQYGREWKAFGGECEGCEITLTSEGFRCTAECDQSWAREDKWPCPGKLAAYIHNESGNARTTPAFEAGQLFEVKSPFALSATEGDVVSTVAVDDSTATVTFNPISFDGEEFEADYSTVIEAILDESIIAGSSDDFLGWGLRIATDESGDPRAIAPDVDDLVMDVEEAFHPAVNTGDRLYIVESDDDNRLLAAHRIGPDERIIFDYESVVEAIRDYDLTKSSASDLGGWGLRLVTTDEGVLRFVAPDLPEYATMQAEDNLAHNLNEGDYAVPIDADDDEQVLTLERIDDGETIELDYETAVSAIRNYDLTKSSASDADVIVIHPLGDESEQAAIQSPYAAKDDIKSLDRDETGRRWDSQRKAWLVDENAHEAVVSHLEDAGWSVHSVL